MQFAQIDTIPEVLDAAKIIVLGGFSFILAFLITPLWSKFLYSHKIGIKIKNKSVDGQKLSYVNKMHAHKAGTPTMGGVIVWGTVLLLAVISFRLSPWLSEKMHSVWVGRLNLISRSQTWLPLFTLFTTALLGLLDDWMSIRKKGSNKGGGMRFAWRLFWVIFMALGGAYWFYSKLGWSGIHLPGVGNFTIGLWYIPLFIFIIVATAFSSNETDGLDGLNAGILIQAFCAFSIISFVQDKTTLAAFCAVIAGALLAFLWFNFYPARFFMGDTGAFSLGATLGIVALLTNSVLVLPLIVSIYVIESLSVIIQLIGKKIFGHKLFLAAPIHHHFEAKGWPETKVTVRFWIINLVIGIVGVLVAIIGRG